MPESLILALVIPVLLQPIVILLTFLRLMQLRYRHASYELQPSSTLSTDLKQLLAPPIQQLKSLGFKPCGAYQTDRCCQIDGADDRGVFLHHPETGTFAEVELRYPADSSDLHSIAFYNLWQDGSWLMTVNGMAHQLLGSFPNNVVLADPYCRTIEEQWQHHQEQLAKLDQTQLFQQLPVAEFVAALQTMLRDYIDTLVIKRSLLPSSQGFFPSWQAALRLAWKMRLATGDVSRRQTALRQISAKNPIAIPVSIQIESFQRMRELESNRRSLRLGKWILLVSLGAFVLVAMVMPRSFGTFRLNDLYSLVFVLFLHEAGHFLAMKAFGYKDTTMFFLPFFGAAVSGKKEDASLTEKVWVLLAGPLPGIVLGLSLLVAVRLNPTWLWLDHTAWLLVGLNLLNLLPFYPLDGGKIAHHLLFSRYPFIDVIFKGGTAVMFGLLGLFGSPMLIWLAIATAISLPSSYRTAKLNQNVQQHLQQNPQDNYLESIFRLMNAAGYHTLPFLKRHAMIKELVERRQEYKASGGSRFALATIYGLSLILSVSGLAILPTMASFMASANPRTAQVKLKQELQELNRAIRRNPKQASLYVDRATLYRTLAFTERFKSVEPSETKELPDLAPGQLQAIRTVEPEDDIPVSKRFQPDPQLLKQALADYNVAIKLAPKVAETYRLRATLREQMQQPQAAIADLTQVIQLQPKDPDGYYDRARLYLTLKNHPAALKDANQLIKLQPQEASAYALRAQVRQQLGDRVGAKRDQQQAQKLISQI
jgi:tetratricopeptide (TPR) repeat protein/Zn-dependent protease